MANITTLARRTISLTRHPCRGCANRSGPIQPGQAVASTTRLESTMTTCQHTTECGRSWSESEGATSPQYPARWPALTSKVSGQEPTLEPHSCSPSPSHGASYSSVLQRPFESWESARLYTSTQHLKLHRNRTTKFLSFMVTTMTDQYLSPSHLCVEVLQASTASYGKD